MSCKLPGSSEVELQGECRDRTLHGSDPQRMEGHNERATRAGRSETRGGAATPCLLRAAEKLGGNA
jgi:hypothetical protein